MSTLTRMGLGLGISILAMVSAALVENRRKRVATREGLLDAPLTPLSMSAFWLLPQIVLLGMTEVLLTAGQMNFFYKEMPDAMRAMGSGLFMSTVAVGYFITSFLITTVNKHTKSGTYLGWLGPNINRGDLQNFYWMLAGLSAVNLAFFALAARLYQYKRVAGPPSAGNGHVQLGAAGNGRNSFSTDVEASPAHLLPHKPDSGHGW